MTEFTIIAHPTAIASESKVRTRCTVAFTVKELLLCKIGNVLKIHVGNIRRSVNYEVPANAHWPTIRTILHSHLQRESGLCIDWQAWNELFHLDSGASGLPADGPILLA